MHQNFPDMPIYVNIVSIQEFKRDDLHPPGLSYFNPKTLKLSIFLSNNVFLFLHDNVYPHYGYASKEGKIEIVSKPIHVHKSKSNSFSFFSNLCNVLRKSNQQYFAQAIKPQNKGNKMDLWKLERKVFLQFF